MHVKILVIHLVHKNPTTITKHIMFVIIMTNDIRYIRLLLIKDNL